MLVLTSLAAFSVAFIGEVWSPPEKSSIRLVVQGMSSPFCGECVKRAISYLPGVDSVQVNTKIGCAEVFGVSSVLRDSSIGRAVRQAGFRIITRTSP
jgi:copper chaperone CopZ